jgi:hypothetical protein
MLTIKNANTKFTPLGDKDATSSTMLPNITYVNALKNFKNFNINLPLI